MWQGSTRPQPDQHRLADLLLLHVLAASQVAAAAQGACHHRADPAAAGQEAAEGAAGCPAEAAPEAGAAGRSEQQKQLPRWQRRIEPDAVAARIAGCAVLKVGESRTAVRSCQATAAGVAALEPRLVCCGHLASILHHRHAAYQEWRLHLEGSVQLWDCWCSMWRQLLRVGELGPVGPGSLLAMLRQLEGMLVQRSLHALHAAGGHDAARAVGCPQVKSRPQRG